MYYWDVVKKFLLCLVFFLAGFSFLSNTAFAKIGVGVNTGKIQVDEKLKAGMIYKLPPITIINTGDEPAEYETSVAYHQDQPELRPKQDWFIFSPKKFHLEPGKAQLVEIKINLPIMIEPGNYFAYLEGHPLATAQKGTTTLGVAAAAKLYFTVVPANIFAGIYYKITSFWQVYSPWPQRAVLVIGLVIAYFLARKYLNINIGLRRARKGVPGESMSRRFRLKRLEDLHKKDEEENG